MTPVHRDPVVVTPSTLRGWPLPSADGGKGARGEVLVVGGSRSTPGAAALAGEAALRAGAGKLAIFTVTSTAGALAVAVPEAAVSGGDEDEGELAVSAVESVATRAADANALLAGPGFGDPAASSALLAALAPRLTGPVILDALASAFLTDHPEGLHHLEGQAVLTVNPVELARTAGWDDQAVEDDPAGAAAEVAERSRVVVACGGTSKHVVAPDGRRWLVEGGGPGLGVSGSGDVHAGIVAGLLARGADPAQAAVWGGYLHARAGERLAATVGTVGYLARELPVEVPAVLSELA